ncbi:hypothetical protein, partial [Kaistella sp.]|uniref:hypothetical protein n=1 Tax=Kaistella sp. TaxID=2782235 RepID=UPI002F94A36F
MHKFLNLSLSLLLLLSFFSCKKSELDTKIIKDGTDCRISNQEWSSYVSMIKADPNSKQFRGVVTEGKLDETKLHQHIQQTVKCKGGNELEIETSNSEVGTVKLFIENSGSIAGYVNQGTDFQSVMVGLNGDLTYNYPDKSEVYLVNQSLEKKGKLS